MKALTLTLLLSFCTLLSMAYYGNTYTVFGETYTFTNKVDLGPQKFLFDCYTDNEGKNWATVVECNDPTGIETDYIWTATIPETVKYNGKTYTVTTIADKAFSDVYTYLECVTIPNTVVTIGNEAFRNCHFLSTINMSKNVLNIGDGAFRDCNSLLDIEFPSSLIYLGKRLVSGCIHLKYIRFNINPKRFDSKSLIDCEVFGVGNYVTVITQTREQAQLAKELFFMDVVSSESEAYINSLENTLQKTVEESNTTIENLASQYTMMQQESQVLQVHNNNLNDCDVNQDGLVNSTDVVTVYNRIIQGGTSSYNGQSYVDLGLPSGTLWATCNVGAPSPECVGDYFAWGENGFYSYRYGLAFGKVEFTEKTYNPAPGVEDIVNGEWPQEYSPLKVIYIAQWDGWKIPSYDQARELTNNCTKEVVTINGQECLELTSKVNKRKIYFPLNGKIDGTSAKETNDVFYWTSSTGSSKYYADIIPFQLHSIYISKDRYLGMGIRPVIMKEDIGQ